MSTSMQSRNRYSVTPSTASESRSSFSRTSPIVSLGQRSSSNEPPSPRVAVMITTREPARTARAAIPAIRYVSSSGWANTPRIVPSSSICCLRPSVRDGILRRAEAGPEPSTDPGNEERPLTGPFFIFPRKGGGSAGELRTSRSGAVCPGSSGRSRLRAASRSRCRCRSRAWSRSRGARTRGLRAPRGTSQAGSRDAFPWPLDPPRPGIRRPVPEGSADPLGRDLPDQESDPLDQLGGGLAAALRPEERLQAGLELGVVGAGMTRGEGLGYLPVG